MNSRVMWAVLAGSVAIGGLQTLRLSEERQAHAKTREDHAQTLKDFEREARRATEAARTEEKRRTVAVQKVADEAYQSYARARADAAAAVDAGQRLRHRIATLAAARCGGPSDPASAGGGAPADATAGMLADVQRRLDQAAERTARFADDAHTAGLACQRIHDEVSTPAGDAGAAL